MGGPSYRRVSREGWGGAARGSHVPQIGPDGAGKAGMARVMTGAVVLGVAVLGLAGCQRNTFSADVRNMTPQPLGAALTIADPSGKASVVSQQRIGPGDRGRVATPRSLPHDWTATLSVDTPGNPGYPANLQLAPGLTVLNVHQRGEGQTGKLSLEEVPRQ